MQGDYVHPIALIFGLVCVDWFAWTAVRRHVKFLGSLRRFSTTAPKKVGD
jgi:hypothetical protein